MAEFDNNNPDPNGLGSALIPPSSRPTEAGLEEGLLAKPTPQVASQPVQGPPDGPPFKRNVGGPRPPAPPKTPVSAFFNWPLVFLIAFFLSIGSCNYVVFTGLNSLSRPDALELLEKPGLGVLDIEGEIYDTRWAVETLREFEKNDYIKAVILRIDSPGGAVAPCQELYQALVEFSKPVVTSMGSVAASGGLYLAVAGNTVIANPGTITGSIGVIMETLEFDGAMEKLGIKSQVIISGPFKDMGSPFRPMKTEERELLQTMVTDVWEQFVRDVTSGRQNLTEPEVRKMADGRIFNGQQALDLGLIDELGGFQKAIDKALALGGITDDDPQLVYRDGRDDSLIRELLESKLGFLSSRRSVLGSSPSLKFLYRPGLF
ncbi:MAG: signal peptide peptidase SppA [Deltaproteobacteria bacterium]|jgi:protease-4|nr:signal peptide peptidase SppA [Deltaproteobacteria bacterium]